MVFARRLWTRIGKNYFAKGDSGGRILPFEAELTRTGHSTPVRCAAADDGQ
jgi:hypothetical protein